MVALQKLPVAVSRRPHETLGHYLRQVPTRQTNRPLDLAITCAITDAQLA
jgi:hypothetical protein